MSQVRFTAWLGQEELAEVRRLAAEEGSSVNYVLRTLLRAALGLPVPRWARERMEELHTWRTVA